MRFEDPLILGAGPAGCAAGLALARHGVRPVLLERQRETGDAICGGFLSWKTIATLESLGVAALGGHPIDSVHVFAGTASASAVLPAGAIGVSRHRLDTVMQTAVAKTGGMVRRGVIAKGWSDGVLTTDSGEIRPQSLFLASGKHDIRGLARPRSDADPTIGLRLRIPAQPGLTRILKGKIELHLFDGGYAGLSLQEDGSANFCLAVRKSRLAAAGGDPAGLLAWLGSANPVLGDRLAYADTLGPIDAIAAIPYGWRARDTQPGLFRLGDQAAVIPSLAGEGIGIAVASGIAATTAWTRGGPAAAPAYQKGFARRAQRPVTAAALLWHYAEQPFFAASAARALSIVPALSRLAARLTRLGD